jgi:hypothetical protein
LNFIQLYIGYIGASRAYGLHFELMDAALFLTNEGITIYLGHNYRWSRKWRFTATNAYVQTKTPASALSISKKPAQVIAAAAGGLATAAQAFATAAVPAPAYAPVVSVVPLKRSNSKTAAKPFASNAPQHGSTDAPAVQTGGRREKVRARAMAG